MSFCARLNNDLFTDMKRNQIYYLLQVVDTSKLISDYTFGCIGCQCATGNNMINKIV